MGRGINHPNTTWGPHYTWDMHFKILNNYFDTNFSDIHTYSTVTTIRGHQFKLFKEHSRLLCRSNYFTNRITNDWNSLPNYVVNSSSINTFKSLLDSYLLDLRFIFG